jgi:hypothetical protein
VASDRQKMDLVNATKAGVLPIHNLPRIEPILVSEDIKSVVDTLDFYYNPDGTLARIASEDVTYVFAWTRNQTLSRVTIRG